MSEELQMAYDMLHHIQCLPLEYKGSIHIDGYKTNMTLVERATIVVKHIEYLERLRQS